MAADILPILSRDPSAPCANAQRPVTVAEFAADILTCADALPAGRHAINLCADRYRFAVAFFAVLVRGQINLLGKRDRATVDDLRTNYPDTVVLADEPESQADRLIDINPATNGSARSPSVNAERTAAVMFTSGSTGAAQPHAKTWRMLCQFRDVQWALLRRTLAPVGPGPDSIGMVATVPPWHMYGLEWTLLVPTVAPITLHCGHAFFPNDVAAACDQLNAPTVLVSTPIHLRGLLRSPPTMGLAATLSATSPLTTGLARQVETSLGGTLLEIYGCSEIGSLAWRLTATNRGWEFLDCFDVTAADNRVRIDSPGLPEPIELADHFERLSDGRFDLLGRVTDIVKIGGKRESLANLNGALLDIPDVVDGVVYRPESLGLPATGRLAALVVAPTLTAKDVRASLATRVDRVFVPRNIRLVPALPREGTSKLSADALRRLLGVCG